MIVRIGSDFQTSLPSVERERVEVAVFAAEEDLAVGDGGRGVRCRDRFRTSSARLPDAASSA